MPDPFLAEAQVEGPAVAEPGKRVGEIVLLQLRDRLAQLQLRSRLPCQGAQRVVLVLAQGAGPAVDDGDRPDRGAVGGEDGSSGVEADLRAALDQRIAGEAAVLQCVADLQRLVGAQNRVGAERPVPRSGLLLDADLRLEPLPVLVDQGDQRDRRAADGGRQRSQVVEALLGVGVEHLVSPQRLETFGLVRRKRGRKILGHGSGVVLDDRGGGTKRTSWLKNVGSHWRCPLGRFGVQATTPPPAPEPPFPSGETGPLVDFLHTAAHRRRASRQKPGRNWGPSRIEREKHGLSKLGEPRRPGRSQEAGPGCGGTATSVLSISRVPPTTAAMASSPPRPTSSRSSRVSGLTTAA